MRVLFLLSIVGLSSIQGFVTRLPLNVQQRGLPLFATSLADVEPLVVASGYSQAIEMTTALEEAVDMALEALPRSALDKIDLAVVSVSSLYDGNAKPSDVVPTVLQAAPGIQNLIGCTNGGFISSLANLDYKPESPACRPIEREGVPGVTVTFMILPDVSVSTFHVLGENVPENDGKTSPEHWKASVGLQGVEKDPSSAVLMFPSPAFQPDLRKLLRGLEMHVSSTVVGAIASTVSSLSRARLFRYCKHDKTCVQTLADGCVGVVLKGDIQIQTMVAQGAKPVGGVYQIVKGQESTISSIALDEAATEIVKQDEETSTEEEDDQEALDDDSGKVEDVRAKMAQAYAKARIPKPVLAEANMLMKTLSDDDQAFMRSALLVGLELAGGRISTDLVRLAEGKGPGFTIHQVASAGVKDGSVTLSLGSVDIKPGQRLRFYVREPTYAKKEAGAFWTGYKRRLLPDGEVEPFTPAGCFIFPTLDRGNKFFLGKSGFESGAAVESIPSIPSISGFFGNGVIARLGSPDSSILEQTSVSGSASGYFLVGSKTKRPKYVPTRNLDEEERAAEEEAAQKADNERVEKLTEGREERIKSMEIAATKAPRDGSGELVLRRREVHSGRAMTVSTVEWSVVDKIATPTSVFEGFMWDKEAEVDRFRERVPLANLVSQCRLSAVDPSNPRPRDWLGPVKEAAKSGSFVIIPECKRMEPGTGSLRKRYDIAKLTTEFTVAGVPAISVNCDGILFGGTLDDVTKARDGAFKASTESSQTKEAAVVPPILASDLLLYPYQLYQLRLAGADAVNLMVAALEAKDLVYLAKIAASLQMQTFVTVTSTKQIEDLGILPAKSVKGLIVSNRNLEDFSFDSTGQQALDLLNSKATTEFRAKHGDENIAILVEGRVGLVTGDEGSSPLDYIMLLKEAGAIGAIVGAGLVPDESKKSPLSTLLQMS